VPFQPLEAEQLVAFVADHVRVLVPPALTVVGEAVKDSVGAAAVTVTVALREIDPPDPEQLSEKVEELVSAPVEIEPLVARLPLHAPEAVHEDAFVVFHVSVDALPLATLVGLAVKVSVGAVGALVTEIVTEPLAVPPAPEQVSV